MEKTRGFVVVVVVVVKGGLGLLDTKRKAQFLKSVGVFNLMLMLFVLVLMLTL